MQSVALWAGLGVLIVTLHAVRTEHIRVEYSVSWFAVGCALLVMAFVPAIPRSLGRVFSLDSQASLAICAGGLVSMLLFEVSRVVSRLRDENVAMAQRLAILEHRLERMRSEDESGERRTAGSAAYRD
jgi:hypothetical protein